MSSKKITTVLIIALTGFVLVLTIQGLLGLATELKEGDGALGVTETSVPSKPGSGSDIAEIERIKSGLGDEALRSLERERIQQGSAEALKGQLRQAEQLACGLQGGTWDFVRGTCKPGR